MQHVYYDQLPAPLNKLKITRVSDLVSDPLLSFLSVLQASETEILCHSLRQPDCTTSRRRATPDISSQKLGCLCSTWHVNYSGGLRIVFILQLGALGSPEDGVPALAFETWEGLRI